jgi:hypothetical protein
MSALADPCARRESHTKNTWEQAAASRAGNMPGSRRQREGTYVFGSRSSAIVGTERSIGFAVLMRQEGFDRFEEALEEFRERFDDRFLREAMTAVP